MIDPVDLDFNREDEMAYMKEEWLENKAADIKADMLTERGYKAPDGLYINWLILDEAIDVAALRFANIEFDVLEKES